MRILLIIGLLALTLLTGCILFPKTTVYYRSPEVSAVLVDAYTGQPIEGATAQVRWSALRPRGLEGSDSIAIHTAVATTDKNGLFKIPAWGPVGAAREWHYYEFDPMLSYSKPGYKSDYKDNHDNQDSVTSRAIPFLTVTLKLPSWAGNNIELQRLDNNIPPTISTSSLSSVPNEVFSNSLSYYVIKGKMVEGGRFIDTPDFPRIGYIRPKPEVIITRIQSFSTNVPKDLLYMNWHAIGLPEDQKWASGFSITLFQEDAIKVAELDRKSIAGQNLLFMLGNQPIAETYMAEDAGYSDSIPIPTGPQTLYLPLRNHQNIQEMNDILQKLVQKK